MFFDIIILSISIFILLILSAFFSGSETALTASTRSRLTGLNIKGKKNAQIAINLLNDKESLIGAILLGNNLVNILASSLATSLLIKMFGDSGVAYAVLIMTVLIVIFAEILPKSYAISNSEKMALTISPIIRPFVFFLSPITWLMEKIVHGILAIFGMNYIKNSRSLSVQDEIRGTVDLHHKEGRLYKFDKDMVKGILDLSVIGIEDVMVHRSNMFTVNIDDDANNIISAAINSPYTRIPVWKNDAENIIGIIHAKNLLRLISTKKNLPILNEDIKKTLLEPWFVPETTTLKEQLQMHLNKRTKLAIIVDEYGALMGMISLEDIIEEIVGDISDEHDVIVKGVDVNSDGSFNINGNVEIRDLNREYGWELPDSEANTISGLIIHESRSFPKPGQKFNYYGFQFEILKTQGNQISLLKVLSAQ
ncbi:HlyC/CorC family transporter [Pelagibacteraceae bacterium]|nr:HlyC/CorC family transporter [Pelagibacteraceae bacterium]